MFTIKNYDFQTVEDVKNWIGGQWVDAASGARLEVTNPRHGKVMTHVALSAASDVDAAVQAAKAAFPGWKATPMKERAQVLYRAKAIMERDARDLAWLISHENGKTFEEGLASVAKAVECLEFGCSLPNIQTGGVSFVSRGITCETHYEPLGVCAGVVPFNFPMMVPMWMLPQALVAGNSFVLKPSEQVPIGANMLARIFREAGLPDGVLNVVNGAREVVEALCDHPEIKAMAFVGSTKVAKLLYTRGAQTGRRMLCLGGAKNHLIVVPDAEVEMTSVDILRSFTGVSGQRCMAASAMIGVGDVQHIIDAVVTKGRALKLGEEMGPIISATSLKRIHGYIEQTEKLGGKILLDGRGATVAGAEGGHWLAPTILEVTAEMPAYRERSLGRSSASCAPKPSTKLSTFKTPMNTPTAARSTPPRARQRATLPAASMPGCAGSTSEYLYHANPILSVDGTTASLDTAISLVSTAIISGPNRARSPPSGRCNPTPLG